jgi:hypothetical protein
MDCWKLCKLNGYERCGHILPWAEANELDPSWNRAAVELALRILLDNSFNQDNRDILVDEHHLSRKEQLAGDIAKSLQRIFFT